MPEYNNDHLTKIRKRMSEICMSVDFKDGLPIIIGNESTFWTMTKKWEGPIRVDDVRYEVRITVGTWTVLDMDRRVVPDKVVDALMQLQVDFRTAFNKEQFLRQGLSVEKRKELNKIYWRENRQQIVLKRKESVRKMAAQHESTVHDIYKMIVQGKTRAEIRTHLESKGDISIRRINQLIQTASKQIQDEIAEERETLKDKHHLMMMDLYQKNIDSGNYKEAHALLVSIGKLYALNEPKTSKVEHTHKVLNFGFDTELSSGPSQSALPEKTIDAEDIEFDEMEEQEKVDKSFLNDLDAEMQKILSKKDDEDEEFDKI